MQLIHSRRDFLAGLSAAGAASVLGAQASLADEGPPEVTTLRIMQQPGVCLAPQFVAEELLGAEGFTNVRCISTPGTQVSMVSHGAKSTSPGTLPPGS
jgi:NitT/TauT family transport system substrate-binding protein